MTDVTNNTINSIIIIALLVFDSIQVLLSALTKGFLKENKIKPPVKTNSELKKMLKKELVELILQYQS